MLACRTSFGSLLRHAPSLRSLSTSSQDVPHTEDEVKEARAWLAKFDAETIPRQMCDFSFSRSSGPGGQNVNKVNSKATLKISLSALEPLVPKLIWPSILSSRYCTQRSDELLIQADDNRKQQDNIHDCLKKLNELIVQAGRDAVPGETSIAQRNRVKSLEKSANESRLKNKKFKSDKKSSRRSSARQDY